jgi:uncharacterized tellurite resistance protein B-like protein
MTDWRKLAMEALVADGQIDDNEVKLLQRVLWEDGKIDAKEVQFLIELRNTAQKKAKAKKTTLNPKFETLFFKAIEENVLRDGQISAKEADWLRRMLFADRKIDDNEKKFLNRIRKAAKKTSPAFERLYQECVAH